MTDEPTRRDLLRELTREAVDAGTYGEPAPEMAPTLRDRLADAMRDMMIQTSTGAAAAGAVAHISWSQLADAVLPVVEAETAKAEQRYKGIAEGYAREIRDLVGQVGEAERERDEQRERADNAEDRLRKATDAYSHLHAQATATDVTRTRWRLRAEQAEVLLRDLVDPDDCYFDHHGGCQAHGYLSLEPGEKCPHAEAKELLAALDQPDGGAPAGEEPVMPVDWDAIARQRVRELKKVGEARHQAEATVQRSREALARFDGRGINNIDTPTPGEVLDAWRASLDQPEATP